MTQAEYQYSSRGQLQSVTTPGKTVSYQHNAMGNRVAKLVDGQLTEKYLWQNLTTLLATYDANNNLKQRFEYTTGNTPTSFTQGGNRYYIASDHLGSPRAISDASGNVVKAIEYDAYGNVISDSNPAFSIPFGFAGGLTDQDTGLIRFGYRDYTPKTGRWTARDPIGFGGGDTNWYAYVGNDPVNFFDLSGLESVEFYISKWLNETDSLKDALDLGREEKMIPNSLPNDADNRTAAEHYLFGIYLSTGGNGIDGQLVYLAAGSYMNIIYQLAKLSEAFPDASPASLNQLTWEQQAWIDGWLIQLGLEPYYFQGCF